MTENQQPLGASYLSLLVEVWPLLVVAFLIALAQGWRGVLHSYRHRNLRETVANIILSSAAMSLIAVGVAWVLPLVGINVKDDPELMMGIVIMVSAVGMKGLDAALRKFAGFSMFNMNDVEQIRDMYMRMTPAQREEHMRNCPFCEARGYCQLLRDDGKDERSR